MKVFGIAEYEGHDCGKANLVCPLIGAPRIAKTLIVSVALSAAPVLGQNAPSRPSNLTEGTKIYAQRCGGCHGDDARGTDKAPGLAGNRRLRDRSVRELRDVIRKGVLGSGMPAFDLPAQELDALVALVRSLSSQSMENVGRAEGPNFVPFARAGIDFARISNPKPGDWLTYNGKLSGNRYSELTQINATNVHKLTLKWIFSVPLWKNSWPDTNYFAENMRYFGLETTPIVAEGIMYVTGPNATFALDTLTGREIWEYTRPRTRDLVGDAALGTNRGVAVLADRVFMVTDNAHLLALNRTTGHVMWEVVMPDEAQHYGSTVAPLIVKDLVIAGVSGGDWGIRGFVAAYRAATGERAWRFWTIPGKGEPGHETWGSKEPAFGGGSTWLTGSYDPQADTLYWSTGNPFPDSDDGERPGDNLYTNSILALNPDNGKLKWHYQVTPHDVRDWDANAPLVLVDTNYRGSDRKLLLHADKNGFFYVLDRTNGHVLLAKNFVRTTWASAVGPDGRPQRSPQDDLICPEVGTNWNATAFSPVTRFYYVVALEKCDAKLTSSGARKSRADEESGKKYLRALDVETGRIIWEAPQIGSVDGKRNAGLLATAGGILFYGDPSGDIVAFDERNGKALWHFPTSGINKASPMTYMVGGKQFVALAVGPNILCFGLP